MFNGEIREITAMKMILGLGLKVIGINGVFRDKKPEYRDKILGLFFSKKEKGLSDFIE